eukprot:TRINITY_DN7140_c0_g1_i1.p1 TRINITY_DN7140_c0_g1~~TRINITY_DN7140_c0_g1_i1.p1  ORF type:complete len:180 (-),score=16.64 TRINITY_DN7140_c0_g1_i1:38-577(-)
MASSPRSSIDTEDDKKTTDTNVRYLAYTGRALFYIQRNVRYLAYMSDVGEAMRLITHKYVVRLSYAVSWLYIIGDVTYDTYKVKQNTQDQKIVVRTALERAIFQSLASMAFPAFTIHTVVHYAKVYADKMGRFIRWGPTLAGFAVIPFLPLIDHPVEHSVSTCFNYFWPVTSQINRVDE